MITYKYKAKNREGHSVNGIIKSIDEYEAVAKLRESNLIVTNIEEIKQSEKKSIFNMDIGSGKIKEKELAIMCSQFSIIIGSGLPIVRCIKMVAEQTSDKDLKKILSNAAEDVDSGISLAQSLESNGKKLPKTLIETIRAGEQSGTLEECFKRLHKFYDKTAKTKAKIVSTLMYPILVVILAIIVFIIIMTVAVPMFKEVFESLGVELPFITKALIFISDIITGYWWVFVGIILIVLVVRIILKRTEKGKIFFATNKLTKTPLHEIHSMNMATQFASTMSTMVAAGIPIVKALDITSQVVDNYSFALSVRKVKEGVEQGRSMEEGMRKDKFFSPLLTEMTGVGEKTGSLENTLDVISDYFNNEVEIKTSRLLQIMEPAMTIGLAVIVVILMCAVYLPLFTMYGSM